MALCIRVPGPGPRSSYVRVMDRESASLSRVFRQHLERDEKKEINLASFGMSESTCTYLLAFLDCQEGKCPINPNLTTPICTTNLTRLIADPVNAAFLDDVWNRSRADFYKLLCASHALGIDSLLDMGCAFIASRVRGQRKSIAKQRLSIS